MKEPKFSPMPVVLSTNATPADYQPPLRSHAADLAELRACQARVEKLSMALLDVRRLVASDEMGVLDRIDLLAAGALASSAPSVGDGSKAVPIDSKGARSETALPHPPSRTLSPSEVKDGG